MDAGALGSYRLPMAPPKARGLRAALLAAVLTGAGARAAPPAPEAARPYGVGRDGFDWLETNPGDWLKGWLDFVQDKDVQFESDELGVFTLKLKDVRQLYVERPMYVRVEGRERVFGAVRLSSTTVSVAGDQPLVVPRELLVGITPGGRRERHFWTGKAAAGYTAQSGNTSQSTLDLDGDLTRRTPGSRLRGVYRSAYSEVDGKQNTNNQRADVDFDLNLSAHWFWRAASLGYFRDQPANIGARGELSTSAGYRIFDTDKLEWRVAVGPAYQNTRYDTVSSGSRRSESLLAAALQTDVYWELTSRLTLGFLYRAVATSPAGGQYVHHNENKLSYEIQRHVDLEASLVWDYRHVTRETQDGAFPKRSDTRLVTDVALKF